MNRPQPSKDSLGQQERNAGAGRCYSCGATGHIARNCRWRGQGTPEAKGRNQPQSKQVVAALVPNHRSSQARSAGQPQPPDDEVDTALEQVMATMHSITPVEKREDTHLGPVPTVTAKLEGIPVEALLDTGSSVSTVALDFLQEALARQRPKGQSLEHWEEAVRKRLERPGMTLKT